MVRALLKLILLSLLLWETKGVAGVLFKQLRENSVNIRPYMEPEGPSLTIDDVAKIPLSQFKSIEEVDASQLQVAKCSRGGEAIAGSSAVRGSLCPHQRSQPTSAKATRRRLQLPATAPAPTSRRARADTLYAPAGARRWRRSSIKLFMPK